MPNILRRPMFKLGGSSSDGVGITSGFRKGYAYGPDYSEIFEEVKSNPNMTSGDYTAMMTKMLPGIMSSMQGAGKLDNYELAMLISDVAGKGGSISDMVTNATTSITPFVDRYKKAQASMGPAAFNMLGTIGTLKAKSETASRPLEKDRALQINRQAEDLFNAAKAQYGSIEKIPQQVRDQYESLKVVALGSAFLSTAQAKAKALEMIGKVEGELDEGDVDRIDAIVDILTGNRWRNPKADGGRVGKNIGGSMQTDMVAENIQTPGGDMEIAASETMEAPTPSQDPYMLLRARLPREITDDVVRLIATNPEAFKDFAAIETQEDVIDFNATYGVELVLPAQQV